MIIKVKILVFCENFMSTETLRNVGGTNACFLLLLFFFILNSAWLLYSFSHNIPIFESKSMKFDKHISLGIYRFFVFFQIVHVSKAALSRSGPRITMPP